MHFDCYEFVVRLLYGIGHIIANNYITEMRLRHRIASNYITEIILGHIIHIIASNYMPLFDL